MAVAASANRLKLYNLSGDEQKVIEQKVIEQPAEVMQVKLGLIGGSEKKTIMSI